MKFFNAINYLKLIKRFNGTCDEVELRSIIIPDEILDKFESWKNHQFLHSKDVDAVLLESINYYGDRFDALIEDISSFNFFGDFLTFYEYYSQARHSKRIVIKNSAQRIRFIWTILEEAIKLKLTTSKRKQKSNTIDDLYTSFIAINNFSNILSINQAE